jgi:Leucine-rich repeat (LRR) protein
VPNVKYIWLSSCHIETIDANAFSHFQGLELLDISYNEKLNFKGMNNALYGLRDNSTLRVLNVNRIHTLWETGIELKSEHMEHLKTLKGLETLHMDLNKIEVFEDKILNESMLPRTLRFFTLSGNRLSYGKYVHNLHLATNITELDISRQHINYDPYFHEHFEPASVESRMSATAESCGECPEPIFEKASVICLPPDIRSLRWRKSFVNFHVREPLCIYGATNLRQLDLSFNIITKWVMPIGGLQNVTHLDLSENYCDEANPKFFSLFNSMTHLNLSGNFLGHSLSSERKIGNASRMFDGMPHLTVLDLSNNKIAHLPKDIFMALNNLTNLNLSGNVLEQWNSTFNRTTCLKHLDLSGNKLATLPPFLTEFLDTLSAGESNSSDTVLLDLGGNPWDCTCQSLPFLRWTLKTNVRWNLKNTDECRADGNRYSFTNKKDIQIITQMLETDVCGDRNNYSWIISLISSTGTAFLSMLICGLVYRSRWKIRYIYYSRNRRYIHEGYDHLFENDAFVSYAKGNASFIKTSMVPSLEQQHDLRLWVADRNSLAGNSIAENITHAIYNSRKVVLLVDKAYLKDKWCDYEMNMALMESVETKRKVLIIVLYEIMPMEDLPLSILKLLQSERSLEYPHHEQDVHTFWMELAEEIRSGS